ncbi:MAG: shikimate dehydrogenase [Chloroflexota bacterium]
MAFNLGLTGYPLGHSLSPKIHKAALASCGLEGGYSLFPIPPDDLDGLKALLARLRRGQLHGLNVTIPHKQAVIPLLDALTPTAEAVGAVNTISMQNGQLTGDNTDAPGFLADLKRCMVISNWELPGTNYQLPITKSALALGAGGSARAIVYALVNDGWDVTISARRPKQAQALIAQFPNTDFRISSIEYHPAALYSLLPALSLIINSTPLGMSPNIHESPWPADLPFPPNAAVYDLVYNPRETKLVREARAAGLPAATGLGMLVEQAALSFEIWTGCSPDRDVLFDTVGATRPG